MLSKIFLLLCLDGLIFIIRTSVDPLQRVRAKTDRIQVAKRQNNVRWHYFVTCFVFQPDDDGDGEQVQAIIWICGSPLFNHWSTIYSCINGTVALSM